MTLATLAPSLHPESDELDRARLRAAIEHAAHLLPAQPPIHSFVHHNTLHAFQHLPFDEAVARAAELLGTEPYESEEAFAEHLARGRITAEDLDAVLAEERGNGVHDADLPGDLTTRALRRLRLEHPMERVQGAALAWLLEEGDALSRFHPRVSTAARERVLRSARRALGSTADEARALRALWACLAPHAPPRPRTSIGKRPRDRVLATTGVDVDRWVHPLLIRVCAAFVDQGVAYWPMPARDRGLLASFRALYARPFGPPDPWMHGLWRTLAAQERLEWDAEQTAIDALRELGVERADWNDVVQATLHALPGWAGMIRQLEERPDRAPVRAPPARLADFLAVALLLEAQAVRYAVREHERAVARNAQSTADAPVAIPIGGDGARPPSDGWPPGREAVDQQGGATGEPRRDDAVVYEAYVLAQLAGLGPSELGCAASARAFVREVAAFGSRERRRLWRLAYEHHHRQRVLDALLAHAELGTVTPRAPRVQALFCIDEREESLRRHLEELDPSIETLGYAGFFGVAMAYRGATDVRPTPLCPVGMRPRHLVTEEPIDPPPAGRRRALGALQHATHVGSRTFVRGGLLSATVGIAAALPLTLRSLFPRAAERLSRSLEHEVFGAPGTRLRFERADGDGPGPNGLLPGFTVAEMTDIVRGVLRTSGIERRLAPLVIAIGHGSSSLNNPHEAAHDCGATGGGRGGPNARAFAAMANHPGVRAALGIPDATWFIGGYHNTCDDALELFDLDLVPATHHPELARVRELFERARRLDAHERCRRFESAPLDLDPDGALAHVERRAADLGEPRPEYGHATNALCIVGRRERTRGLFLDRRAFLVSYDPTRDEDGAILGPLLASVVPVCAGISLEYYFSFVDPTGYGCGTKLPHNIVGLLGVMDGHASDLRTGLPWQMVEIHEPVRLLTIVEAEPALLERLLEHLPGVREVIVNRWIQLAAWSPSDGRMWFFSDRGFLPHERRSRELHTARTSVDYYRGRREHLDCARIEAALEAP